MLFWIIYVLKNKVDHFNQLFAVTLQKYCEFLELSSSFCYALVNSYVRSVLPKN